MEKLRSLFGFGDSEKPEENEETSDSKGREVLCYLMNQMYRANVIENADTIKHWTTMDEDFYSLCEDVLLFSYSKSYLKRMSPADWNLMYGMLLEQAKTNAKFVCSSEKVFPIPFTSKYAKQTCGILQRYERLVSLRNEQKLKDLLQEARQQASFWKKRALDAEETTRKLKNLIERFLCWNPNPSLRNQNSAKKQKLSICALTNEKFTCFLNSILQCFFVLKYFHSELPVNFENAIFSRALSKLLHEMKKSALTSPMKLYDLLMDSQEAENFDWIYGAQQCASEALTIIFMILRKENQSISPSAGIMTRFEGEKTITYKCSLCAPIVSKDPFDVLLLPISSGVSTVKECLDDSLKEHDVETCTKCKKGIMKECTILSKVPQTLVIALSRFKRKGNYFTKNSQKVKPTMSFNIADSVYNCVGLVQHHGDSIEHGHYTACIKFENIWYECNDQIITNIDQETLLQKQPFIIFYEKL